MRAESYVYLFNDEEAEPRGYVGRHPRGNCQKVGDPGDSTAAISANVNSYGNATTGDNVVAFLGLGDLKDHTDYAKIHKRAVKAGANVTVRDTKTGKIKAEKATAKNAPKG